MEVDNVKITAIQAQKRKGRYNIFIDGHYRFPVSDEVLIQFRLHKDQEITDDQIKVITDADSTSKAYNKALDYLSYQLRTEKEIIQYLQQHEFTDLQIEPVLQRLRTQGYINDLEYAKSYVRTIAKTSDKGPKVITQNLRKKGVLENDIETALDEFPFEDQLQNSIKIAQKLAHKYHREAFKIQIQKIKNGLFAKGFSSEIATEAINQLGLEKNEDQEKEQLHLQGAKIMRRYQRLPLSQRNQKVKMALYRKGFSMDEINQFIDEQN